MRKRKAVRLLLTKSGSAVRKTMIIDEIRKELFELQDVRYRDFQSKLIPTASPDIFIGVRTPLLRKMAKEMSKREDIEVFLNTLPHTYFDENQLHAFVLSGIKDYGKCLSLVDQFLPYVDNWATCDQMSPKVFQKHKDQLLTSVRKWIDSDAVYTVRFGIGMLMQHYLDEAFSPAYPEMVATVRSEEYYIRMMAAWYFATALAKQYDAVLPYLKEHRLDPWTHNKTIQKAIESYRISPEQKEYLRGLKRK